MVDYDATIIGSGAGGLSAALNLARSHYSVMLLEAMPSFGGYLNPFRRKGYTFDTDGTWGPAVRTDTTIWTDRGSDITEETKRAIDELYTMTDVIEMPSVLRDIS